MCICLISLGNLPPEKTKKQKKEIMKSQVIVCLRLHLKVISISLDKENDFLERVQYCIPKIFMCISFP